MFSKLQQWGISSTILYYASIGSVLLSVVMWFARRKVDDRPSAQRFGIFVGLWPPTLMIMGKIMEDMERRS